MNLHACLQTEDLELLLARRGHPTLSHDEPLREALVERLGKALSDEFCRFEWESQQVPGFHSGAPPPGPQLFCQHCLSCSSGASAAWATCEVPALPQPCTPDTARLICIYHFGVLWPCTAPSCRRRAQSLPVVVARFLKETLTAAAPAAVMETAGGTMLTRDNSILVYGGMDSNRKEHNRLWKWDLSSERGFKLCRNYTG